MMIKLIIDTLEYDISNYIDEGSIVYSDNIDETKAHGGFTIPFIKPNALVALDMSKPLARLMQCVIEIDDETTYWLVSEDKVDKVRKGTNPLYSHEITLIEPTTNLERRVLPNMTVTQPKGTIDNYIYEINQVDGEEDITLQISGIEFDENYEQTGVKVTNTASTLDFIYGTPTDDSVIDENELLEVRAYDIQLNYQVYNVQHDFSEDTVPEATLEFTIYADGVLKDTYTQEVGAATKIFRLFQDDLLFPKVVNGKYTFSYTPSSVGEVITIKARTTSYYIDGLYNDELWITKLGFNILTYQEGETEKIMLDDVVDKILLIQTSAPLAFPTQEFTLASATRNRIANVISPEFTFNGYTVYDALNEVASYVGAIVYLGEDDFTTIHFHFYDDTGIESNIDYLEEMQNVYLTDYVTGLEINAQNVIKEDAEQYVSVEPSETGFVSIRGSGIGAINDTNATVATSRPFYKSYKVLVKGLAFEMLDDTTPVSFADTVEWDIANFTVEQTKWNALGNQALDTRSAVLNKGNTIYYIQGQKGLNNITYNDVILAPAWNTALAANYAIVEAILCQAAIENPTYTFASDYKPTVDIFDLKFRVYYMPYSNARVTVYRDDAAILNQSIKYFNETASINDMKLLGDVAKKHVNRKGNVISSYKGFTSNISNLIRLGMKNDRGEILTAYEIAVSPLVREFVLHYSMDNPNISAYKGTPSAYRQYEIPVNDLVYRKDKYTEFVYLSETDDDSTYSIYDIEQLLANFKPTPDGEKLTYALVMLDYDGSGYTETVEATVDTLAFGNTTAIQIEMQDNYSAGAKQVSGIVVGNVTQVRQADTLYGDDLGRVENIKILTYTTYSSDADNYPDNDTVTTGEQSQLEIAVKKDAREIWGITQELVFRSNYSNIRVFSGIAKFNGFVAKGSTVETRPFLLKKGYFPSNDTIDLTKVIQTAWDSTVTDNELETEFVVPIGEYEGYVWVEATNFQPIFAVKTSEFDTIYGATLAHSVYISTSYGQMIANISEDLTDSIDLEDTYTATAFVFPITTLEDTLTLTSLLDEIKSTDYVEDLTSTMTLTDTRGESQFVFPIIDLENTITLTSVWLPIKSTDYVEDLTSTMSLTSIVSLYQSSDYVTDLEDTIPLQALMSIYTSDDYVVNMGSSFDLSDTMHLYKSTDYLIHLSSSAAMTDTMHLIRSTDYVISLEGSLTLNSAIDNYVSTDYVMNMSDSLTFSDSLTAVKSTNFVINLSGSLTLTSSITSDMTTSNWTYIGTSGSYNKSVFYIGEGSTCASSYTIEAWLDTNYPSSDYTYGYVIRVARGNEDLHPCTPSAYYYQAS